MRTTFTREIDENGSSDTLLTQNPPQDGEDVVSKWPVKVKFRNKVFAKIYRPCAGRESHPPPSGHCQLLGTLRADSSLRWPRPSASPSMSCWENPGRGDWSRRAAGSARYSTRSPSCHAASNRRSSRWPKDFWPCTSTPTATPDFLFSRRSLGASKKQSRDHLRLVAAGSLPAARGCI